MPDYAYEIIQSNLPSRPGWRLRLLEDGTEMGGGIFPASPGDASVGITWWNSLSEREREYWLIAADSQLPSVAWQTCLLMRALEDACDEGEMWLRTRRDYLPP